MDCMTAEQRSRNMARIRGRDTVPEMVVRRLLHRLGYRYRLHDRYLPGKPDLVFRAKRCILFVHGCYWHRHPGCRFAFVPQTRADFWTRKFARNVERDRRVTQELQDTGWRVLVVWSCEVGNVDELSANLVAFLGSAGSVQNATPCSEKGLVPRAGQTHRGTAAGI
ncbi:MAG TPA: very short patch repair endonuclease [Stellaceae bacterium]|nr:very short patch repair endonuclease [Stellaceae bacterium]